LSGVDADNYTFNASASTTADITPRALAVSASGVNKVYDGTVAATFSLTDNRVPGDALTTGYTAAAFADKHVGTAKPISVTGITVTGPDAINYTFNSSAATSADITPRALLVSATGPNKAYDGPTAATVTLSDDRVPGDTLTATYASATFADKLIGTAKPIAVTGIA